MCKPFGATKNHQFSISSQNHLSGLHLPFTSTGLLYDLLLPAVNLCPSSSEERREVLGRQHRRGAGHADLAGRAAAA